MAEDETQSSQQEALERGHDFGLQRNDDASIAEDMADRVFDALDVNNEGEVDLCELASGLSVRWTHIGCTHGGLKWLLRSCCYSVQAEFMCCCCF